MKYQPHYHRLWENYIVETFLEPGSVGDVLQILDEFSDNTFIFFDIEATGFKAGAYDQILEIAALAVDPQDWMSEPNVIDQFNIKAHLTPFMQTVLDDPNSEEFQKWLADQEGTKMKFTSLDQLLDMVQYEGGEQERVEEGECIARFIEWLNGYNDPLLIAHNAKYDNNFLLKRSEGKFPNMRVLDTLFVARKFLIPILEGLKQKDPNLVKQILSVISKGQTKKGVPKYTFSQGALARAFKIDATNWHSAIADVEMLMGLLQTIMKIAKARNIV